MMLLVGPSDNRIIHDEEIASTVYLKEVVQEFLGFWVQSKSWAIGIDRVDNSECTVKLAGISKVFGKGYHF